MERADKISSLKKSPVKALRASRPGGAVEQGRFLVEGPVMLREALSCGLRPQCLLFDQDRPDPDLLHSMAAAGARLYAVPSQVLEAVCPTRTPQGVCCAFDLLDSAPWKGWGTGSPL